MAQNAKIALSEQELHLLLNKDWILTKRSLIQKADMLLGMAVPGLQELITAHSWLPPNLLGANPKIHRGENYRGLPYVILDYPAFFSKAGVMALRSMFWWGHFFSVTLHISGTYKTQLVDSLLQKAHLMQQGGMAICTGEDEWEHHFGTDNYTDAHELSMVQLQQVISEKKFVKIAMKTDLTQWESMPGIIVQQTSALLTLLNCPSGETGL
jgi:hypothetical protein